MSEQRSAEWFAERCGKVTASRIADVVAKTKTGWGASRANYAAQLIAERLTRTTAESYQNKEMAWGTEQEPFARDAYAFHANVDVAECGFVPHPTISQSGASPDGIVGDGGLIEIKCPNTASHIDTLLGEPIAQKYLLQMQWQMACTSRAWCDYVSFDPRLPERMRVFIKRVPRDDKLIVTLERDVELFLREIQTKLDALAADFAEKAA